MDQYLICSDDNRITCHFGNQLRFGLCKCFCDLSKWFLLAKKITFDGIFIHISRCDFYMSTRVP